MFVKEGRSLW